MTRYFPHSENSIGIKHDLVERLKNVTALVGKFAEKLGAADFGYRAGLWNNSGRFHINFSEYSRTKGLYDDSLLCSFTAL